MSQLSQLSHPQVAQLSKPEIVNNSERLLALLLSLREEVEKGGLSPSELVSSLVKLIASNNAAVKGEVCHLLILAAANEPDLGLLVVNTLTKDIADPNPAVRSTAVTAICSLPVLLSHATAAISTGLRDSNPGVRVSAVTGVGRLWRHSPEECHQLGLVNKLYEMLRDPEPTVVTFSIQTLNIVLADEGGIVINNNMVKYFLPRISDYKEKELCFLLDFLAIKDMDDQLRLKLLNTFDPMLDRREGSVVLAVARLLTSVVEEQPSLRSSLVRRISPIMISFLKTSHKEFSVLVIDFLSSLSKDYVCEMKTSLPMFYLKNKDSEKLKSRKILFFRRLVDEDNAMEIVNYLFNLLPQSSNLNRAIFKTISSISQQEPSCYDHCLNNFQMLLKADREKYVPDILNISDSLGLHKNNDSGLKQKSEFVASILDNLTSEQLSDQNVAQVMKLLQDFCPHLPKSPYYYEDILTNKNLTWTSPLHLCLLLTCCVTLLLEHPPGMQLLAARTFQMCSKHKDHQLQENLTIYYNLLKRIGKKG